MPPMGSSAPNFNPDEKIILKGQGGYRTRSRRGWKPALVFLTDQRLVFYQMPRIQLEVALSHVKSLRMGREYYVLKERDYLCISYDAGDSSTRGEVFLIVNRVGEWRKMIHQLSLLRLDEDTVEKITSQMDSDGRDILWYLWENRHAKISQLCDLIDAPSHMHVLILIKETINPVSQKVVGCPILSFERSRVDSQTGETILFSWWLVGQQERCTPNEQRLIDIFDEGTHVQVIMEVRGIEVQDVQLDLDGDELTVRSHRLGASLRETFRLLTAATLEGHQISLKNNLLEIKLPKAQCPKTGGQGADGRKRGPKAEGRRQWKANNDNRMTMYGGEGK